MLVLYLSDGYLIGMAVWLVILAALFFGVLWGRRRQRARGRGLFLPNLGLSLCMLLAVVTAGELAFACFADFSDTFNITNVSKRWLALHIDHERNNEGNRDHEPFTKYVPAGKKRIIFLGDSFTIGHGIKRMDDRFSNRVAEWLNEKAPGQYVVANLGDPGLETSQIESLAAGVMLKMQADVSMFIYVYNLNDIEGYMDLAGQKPLEGIYTAGPQFFLFRDTYLLNWLYFRFRQFQGRNRPVFRQACGVVSDRSLGWPAGQAGPTGPRVQAAARRAANGDLSLPARFEGSRCVSRSPAPGWPISASRKRSPLLDLDPIFRQHAGENLMVSRFDAHPNERAHAIAAEAMRKDLLSDLFARQSRDPHESPNDMTSRATTPGATSPGAASAARSVPLNDASGCRWLRY